MSWIRESSFNWFHYICAQVLKLGPIPKHVAFIMDGNRRFAKKKNVEKLEGHTRGFDKLSETLQWCLDLGITEVTVYAFSIENFKRNEEEVNGLMDLAREKFKRLINEREKLKERGVRINVIGNIKLLPDDIIRLVVQAESITRNNNKAVLNVALAYTSRDEITRGVQSTLEDYKGGKLNPDDILSKEDFLKQLYKSTTGQVPDMIIRTSGETRLSDFMLFQGCATFIHFTKVLWPELTPWDLLSAIFQYQCVYSKLCKVRDSIFTGYANDSDGSAYADVLLSRERWENKIHVEKLKS